MKLKFFGLMLISLAICVVSVTAHPLGNFSVNQYSRLEVENSRIKIRQILDMAEIPTFQTKSEIDTNKDGALSDAELKAYADKITPGYIGNLILSVNNQPLEIRAESKTVELKPGAGNLPTLEIKWNLTADLPAADAVNRVNFENKNYGERLGWNEIVVNRFGDIKVFDSTAYGSGVTEELKAYPEETLNAPLSERTAAFSFTTGAVPENAGLLQNRDGHTTVAVQKDRFAELIDVPEITPTIALFGLLLAFGLGAMHAMSPGHGKTVVGAYLVGSRGTLKHAIFLGLTVTITHTLGVFALGLITIFASNFILPEKLMPFLSFVSGLLVFFIGISLFKDRLFSALGWKAASHHQHHEHGHTHSHEEEHSHAHHEHENHSHDDLTHTHGGSTHTHLPPEDITWKSLLALGISGGLLPCPSALVLMLSAISLGRVGYGLVLTLAFSFGLAATLTAVGLVFLYVGKAFGGSSLAQNRLVKTLPVFSAFVIACVGAVICYNSLG
jgi:nickel/cobalt transporter (NicO) family protein